MDNRSKLLTDKIEPTLLRDRFKKSSKWFSLIKELLKTLNTFDKVEVSISFASLQYRKLTQLGKSKQTHKSNSIHNGNLRHCIYCDAKSHGPHTRNSCFFQVYKDPRNLISYHEPRHSSKRYPLHTEDPAYPQAINTDNFILKLNISDRFYIDHGTEFFIHVQSDMRYMVHYFMFTTAKEYLDLGVKGYPLYRICDHVVAFNKI